MRPDKNPLDLNNLPEDCSGDRSEDGKLALDENGIAATEATSDKEYKKRNGGKEAQDERGKTYECRFCSLKFCKSQALGGHMNRHRQEKEKETLNQARQLLRISEKLVETQKYLGTIPQENFHRGTMEDSSLNLQSIYKRASGSSILLPRPLQPHLRPTSLHICFPSPSLHVTNLRGDQNHSSPS